MVRGEKRGVCRFVGIGILALMCSYRSSVPAMAADTEAIKPQNPSRAEQANPGKMIRASKIVDHPVYNESGEEIAEVDDLIMSRNGKIKNVILQTKEKLVAVPFSSVKRTDEDHIVYRGTRDQLERGAKFRYLTEGLQGKPFYPFPPYGVGWGYQAPSPSASFGGASGPFFRRGKCRGECDPWEWEYYPERLRVSALLDEGILDKTGEEVADLDDLMIAPEGKVERIILDVGGFLGMRERLVAVPFRPLKVTDLGIVCPVTKEQLQKSPAFSYDEK